MRRPTEQLQLFVTIQYLHSYVQKSIPDQLRWWDFCLPAYVFLRSAQQVRRPTEQLQLFYIIQEILTYDNGKIQDVLYNTSKNIS